jgi:hypothetical protein
MKVYEVRHQVVALLRTRGQVIYRVLKRDTQQALRRTQYIVGDLRPVH